MVLTLLDFYRQGLFPMADLPASPRVHQQAMIASDDPTRALPSARSIGLYSPDPRSILPLEPGGLHVPGGLRRHVRRTALVFTSDRCFDRVIRACARPRADCGPEGSNGLWIDQTLADLYTQVHYAGHAHSIEAWRIPPGMSVQTALDDDAAILVGGIYGVHIGAAFFAESMFCRPQLGGTNASNLCLLQLVAHLRRRGFELMDVQIGNEHTRRFGVIDIPRSAYLERLAHSTSSAATWGTLEPERIAEILSP